MSASVLSVVDLWCGFHSTHGARVQEVVLVPVRSGTYQKCRWLVFVWLHASRCLKTRWSWPKEINSNPTGTVQYVLEANYSTVLRRTPFALSAVSVATATNTARFPFDLRFSNHFECRQNNEFFFPFRFFLIRTLFWTSASR